MVGIALETLAIAQPERLDRIGVQRQLAARQQAHVFQRVARALRFRIELADDLDLVVEQVHAQRRLRAHREHVEQRAAQCELAGRADLRYRGIARLHQPRAQRFDRQLVADRKVERAAIDIAARRDSLAQRVGRGQQHRGLQARQFGERREPLGNDVRMRREQVVGQHFPVGQHVDRCDAAEEERELGAQLVELARIARDDQVRTCVRFDGFGQRQAARGAIELVPALARRGRREGAGGAGTALRKRGSLPCHARQLTPRAAWPFGCRYREV